MANNQTQRDTELAKNRRTRFNNNDNIRTQMDTSRADSRTRRGSQENFDNDKRNEINRRFDSMEFNSGMTLAGNDTKSGRDFYKFKRNNSRSEEVYDWGVFDDDSGSGGGAGSGGGGSGGGSSEFSEEILDIVEAPNTPAQRVFLTKEVPPE